MGLEEQVKHYFNSGYNCAESVLLAVTEQLGPAKEGVNSVVPRTATGFGGGIARNGDTCGAITGGVMAISIALGRDMSEESRDPCYRAVDCFYTDFVRVFGTCKCRELTGLDMKKPAEMDTYRTKVHAEVCNPIVAWAAKRAQQIIQSDD
jgi:C_GCAxxG_C_C family probable redox protein